MVKGWIEFDGFMYPIIKIEGKKIDNECTTDEVYTICDINLWTDVLERPCMNGDKKANEIDAQIFFYCDNGLVASNPTEEEVIEYFRGLTFE